MALDKKQVALTVVGSLAGLGLTYLLWRRSEQAAASAGDNAAANAAIDSEAQQSNDASYYPSSPVMPQFTLPAISTSTTDASTDTAASNGTDIGAGINGLLEDIIETFGSNNAEHIPVVPDAGVAQLANIPTTATQAINSTGVSVGNSTISNGAITSGTVATPITYDPGQTVLTPGSGVTMSPGGTLHSPAIIAEAM